MLEVPAGLHVQVEAVRLSNLIMHLKENHIFECDILSAGNDPVEIEPDYAQVPDLKMFDFLVLEKRIAKGRPSMVQGVDMQVKLPIEDVVEDPLIIVREIVIQLYMHDVWQLYHLAVPCWINVARLEIIYDLPYRTEFVDLCLNEELESLRESPDHK